MASEVRPSKSVEAPIPDSTESFSQDYSEARDKFMAASQACGGGLTSIEHPELGPDGRKLFVDVAYFGPSAPSNMIVLVSGTHGVEGFCGSGAQVDLLRRREVDGLPPDVAVLMIHAVNPYGFAWLRRATHENIDLNRNWVDFNSPLPVNDGYRQLHKALCPKRWSMESQKEGEDALRYFKDRYGLAAAKSALGAGQYEFPEGIYFGGRSASWSRVTQSEIFSNFASSCKQILIIDYHTGLGPWGYGELIMTCPPVSRAFQKAAGWFGASLKSTVDGSSVGADIGGDGLSGIARLLPKADVIGVALEIGTLPRDDVISAHRAENWFHHYGDINSHCGKPIKRALRDAYYGERQDWKGMVAGQSLLIWRQALAAMAGVVASKS